MSFHRLKYELRVTRLSEARVAKLADALRSERSGSNPMEVQILSRAHIPCIHALRHVCMELIDRLEGFEQRSDVATAVATASWWSARVPTTGRGERRDQILSVLISVLSIIRTTA